MTADHNRIYIDFDDCLSQTAVALLKVLKEKFNKTVPYEAIVSFDLEKSFSLSKDEWYQLMQMAHESDTLLGMPVIEGAREALAHLFDSGYEIHVVTGRPPSTKKVSINWLSLHQIPYHKIFFVDKYKRFEGQNQDDSFLTLADLKKERYLFAVEDSASMAEFVSTEMNTPVFLLDRPWNQGAKNTSPKGPIIRCSSWDAVIKNSSNLKPLTVNR